MPVFRLPETHQFPPVHLAEADGLLAVGGDLSVERLVAAYRQGIFPWYNEEDPILWWSPDPRAVLRPDEVKVSKSMKQFMRRTSLEVRFDTAFEEVIAGCARQPREGQDGTWIVAEMQAAYCALHEAGFAHSVEVWDVGPSEDLDVEFLPGDSTQKQSSAKGKLVGGLYGLSMGSCFFGESMFSRQSNASKLAFVHLCRKLQETGFSLIDCQVHNAHLESMGAYEIPREQFLEMLANGLGQSTTMNWKAD